MGVDLSVVVAVYNEDPRNLEALLDRLDRALAPTGQSFEVVFVNDGSGSQTSKALHDLALAEDHVKLVVLSRNFGQQAAITAGLDHADGLAVVNIDSDCQDPPELIPEMLNYWAQGYEVVYAKRLSRRDRLGKRLSAYLFYRVLGALSSVNIPWDTGDFRLMDRKVVDALSAMPEGTRFLRGQVPWLGFKQIGIPIERGAREVGESTYTLRKLVSLAMDGLLAFSMAPLYLVAIAGFFLLAAGLAGLAVAGMFCLAGVAVHWAYFAAAAVSAVTGIQISCTGVVAVYLSRVLDEVRARPTYLVTERIGLPFAASERPDVIARPPVRDFRVKEHERVDAQHSG